MKAPSASERTVLITASDAIRAFDLDERHLYQWVAAGRIRAYTSRFAKWPLYSEAEIAAVMAGRVVAGGSPEGEIAEAAWFFDTVERLELLNQEIKAAGAAGDMFSVATLSEEAERLLRQLRRRPPSGGGETLEGGPAAKGLYPASGYEWAAA